MATASKIKYWQDRARNAEALLRHEAHMNSFMIKWLKKVHPVIHQEMHLFYAQQSNARLKGMQQRIYRSRRERMETV